MLARDDAEQVLVFCGSTGWVTAAGQLPYGAGHVTGTPHARGTASVLQVVLVAKQSAQAAPPEPHERLVKPARQRSPEQQPGQLAALQAGFWQTPPAAQVPAAPQSLQAWPAVPQAAGSLPVTQVLPWQQPAQLPGPHAGPPVHTPPAPHVWFCPVQFKHATPLVPHAVSCVPSVHTLPMQQPLQLSGPQGGGSMHVRPFG